MFGFPMGRTFTGSEDDIAKIKRDFKRKIDYSEPSLASSEDEQQEGAHDPVSYSA